jgi:hypothetical protein
MDLFAMPKLALLAVVLTLALWAFIARKDT